MKKANHAENLGKKFGRLTIKEVIKAKEIIKSWK